MNLSEREFKKYMGEKIDARRIKAGLTKTKLAKEIYLSVSQVSRIISGEASIAAYQLYMICEVLAASPESFFPKTESILPCTPPTKMTGVIHKALNNPEFDINKSGNRVYEQIISESIEAQRLKEIVNDYLETNSSVYNGLGLEITKKIENSSKKKNCDLGLLQCKELSEYDYTVCLGKALQDNRKRRKVSQDLLANTIGINRSQLSEVENGKASLNCFQLYKSCQALAIPVEKLFASISSVMQSSLPSVTENILQTTIKNEDEYRKVVAYSDRYLTEHPEYFESFSAYLSKKVPDGNR